jgi:hypothetical protein
MNRTRWSQGLKSFLVVLGVTVAACATAHAGDSNTPPPGNEPAAAPAQKPSSDKPTPPVKRTPASFTRQMPFGEATDILRNCTTPPLNIVVLWRQLEENAGITKDTAIGIDGVPGLRVGQCLDLLMLSLSAGASAKLGYVVNGGVITIGTVGALPAPKMVTRVYDISDLVSEPARYFLTPIGFGMMPFPLLRADLAPALATGALRTR